MKNKGSSINYGWWGGVKNPGNMDNVIYGWTLSLAYTYYTSQHLNKDSFKALNCENTRFHHKFAIWQVSLIFKKDEHPW